MFGNPETTTGGNALKFYASVRLDIRRIGSLKDGEQVTGSRTRVKVVKNKLAAPFKETEFDVCYGQGISRAGEIIDLGVEAGVLEKSGSWIAYGSERIGQGREAARQYLVEHQDVLRAIRAQILEKSGLDRRVVSEVSATNCTEVQVTEMKPAAPVKAAERPATKRAAAAA